jgi:hypothetical protein
MNETSQPYDPTAIHEPTGPAGRAHWTARLRRLATPMLAGAVALLLAGAAGGYLLGSRAAGTAPTNVVSSAAEGSVGTGSFDPYSGAAPCGPCGPGGFGRGGHGTAGTIDSVNGTTITLTTPNGRKVTVTAADTVAVTVHSPGSLSDLKPGQNVVVSGQRGADGNIAANRIDVGAPR